MELEEFLLLAEENPEEAEVFLNKTYEDIEKEVEKRKKNIEGVYVVFGVMCFVFGLVGLFVASLYVGWFTELSQLVLQSCQNGVCIPCP